MVRRGAATVSQAGVEFYVLNGQLYQLVLTPVYLDDARGASLSKVLVTGFVVNPLVALRLRESTGDSEFLFLSESRVFASTLNDRATGVLREKLAVGGVSDLVSDGVTEYAVSRSDLIDLEGRPVGQLCILRSFDAARDRIGSVQSYLVLIWMCAVAIGLEASATCWRGASCNRCGCWIRGQPRSRDRTTVSACQWRATTNWAGWRAHSTRCADRCRRRGRS
ncbi:MAG: hypothetical protein R2762_09595 [Bryobacteraceae bacterium]